MRTAYQPYEPLPPADGGHFQWPAALKAGLIAGVIALVFPRGNPWATQSFFPPAIMGRAIPPQDLPLVLGWLIHLLVAVIYGFIIGWVVARLTQWRAIITGGLVGVALYGLNWFVVHLWFVRREGNEASVLFLHIFFGLIAAAAYRGLLRRKAVASGG